MGDTFTSIMSDFDSDERMKIEELESEMTEQAEDTIRRLVKEELRLAEAMVVY